MSCPHCDAAVPEHRIGPRGGRCRGCGRLFVPEVPVPHDSFTTRLLTEQVRAVGRDGELRFTPLQLQHAVWRHRAYAPKPFWSEVGARYRREYRPPVGSARRPYWFMVVVVYAIAVYVFAVHLAPWAEEGWWQGAVVGAASFGFFGFWALPLLPFAAVGLARSLTTVAADRVRRRRPSDEHPRALTPAAFTALVLDVWAREHGGAPPGMLVEHGMHPPAPPDPVQVAVLCPDPAAAACLWGNDVAGELGALVVTDEEDVPAGVAVIDLRDASPDQPPAALLGRLMREWMGARDTGAPVLGFLDGPVAA